MSQERLLKVLLAPHVSEKSSLLAEAQSQYVFKVTPDATKQEVKMAVETLFNVKVESVNVLNQKGKRKVFKGRAGVRSGSRKAVVKLVAGQELDFVSGE
ncbi:50S ribosomal protein L23 [Thiomicrospira microaerophila]|uniref:50S ribosomal protein L23 n=1 Tax=Thiomicrospira microaerophila TaxID=406020 RepID=UPI00200D79A2|nr:50S ribosomal protein L23 [Thiomicrospira microaerophila]UQB42008.1 50S ribosomal protein L23 [Thiomicrospira microaerophila]